MSDNEIMDGNTLQDAIVLEFEDKMEKMRTDYEQRISDIERKAYEREFYHALARDIIGFKGKNFKAVCSLLDLSELSLSEDGEIEGLSEQVEKIRASDGYLFYDADESKPVMGNVGNFPRKAAAGKANPWSKEGYNLTEQGRIMRESPEKAKRLMRQAGAWQ